MMIRFLKLVHYKILYNLIALCITSIKTQNTALDFYVSNDYVHITDDTSFTSTSAITIIAWLSSYSIPVKLL